MSLRFKPRIYSKLVFYRAHFCPGVSLMEFIMADWWGTSRSNYFKVKNEAAFLSWLSELGEVSVLHEDNDYVAITGDNFGGWPTCRGEDGEPFDFAGELSGFLADGEIAVLIETGAENLRYITGVAIAIDSHGKRTEIVLSDIYDEAEAVFGRRPPDATY
jgi:hypothetical protein